MLPDRASRPSGPKATLDTQSVCPSKRRNSLLRSPEAARSSAAEAAPGPGPAGWDSVACSTWIGRGLPHEGQFAAPATLASIWKEHRQLGQLIRTMDTDRGIEDGLDH